MKSYRYRGRGFTLIELMVVVVIIGILAAVAFPSYREHARRGHRGAAQAEMMDIANREQQYYLAKRSYASKSDIETGGYALPSDLTSRYSYDITLDAGPPPGFVITFTAIGDQAADGALSLGSDGEKTPAEKW